MISVKKEGVILKSTHMEFESQAVLNPGCIQEGNNVHMFYRAVKPGNFSSIGYCRLNGPLKVVERADYPILYPQNGYERRGTEDPRIVKINGTYYLTYIAYNGKDVVAAYAISKNMKRFEKKKPMTYNISYAEAKKLFIAANLNQKYFNYVLYDRLEHDTAKTVYLWGKDVVLFPRKIKGKFAMLYRILPNMHLAYFNKFSDLTVNFWKEQFKELSKHTVLDTRYWFESRVIGAGAPPIETKKGWLIIYHAVENSPEGKIYRAAAALLDKNNPSKVIGRLPYPLFSPETEWELKGDVDNVVFPTGTALFKNKLYIYYGAADKRIAVASVDINKLVGELLKYRHT